MAETLYRVRRSNPGLEGGAIAAAHDNMITVMDLRVADYPSGHDAAQIADPFDRHIHAAAVAGGVNCIITNDRGFTELPMALRDELEYEIYTPDEFFVLIDDSSPALVRATVQRQITPTSPNAKTRITTCLRHCSVRGAPSSQAG
jgi:hypothetical protein